MILKGLIENIIREIVAKAFNAKEGIVWSFELCILRKKLSVLGKRDLYNKEIIFYKNFLVNLNKIFTLNEILYTFKYFGGIIIKIFVLQAGFSYSICSWFKEI